MPPPVLIIEPRRDVAAALEEAVNSANYLAVVRPHLDQLSDLGLRPAAIIVRVAFDSASEPAHAAIARLPRDRPPVLAIALDALAAAEATRLKCDVVLGDVRQLFTELGRVVRA